MRVDDPTEQLKEFIGSHRIKRRVVDTTEQVVEVKEQMKGEMMKQQNR